METNTRRLHPLLTAAISVTVFSAVGVAVTGLIPTRSAPTSRKPQSNPHRKSRSQSEPVAIGPVVAR
jgi:hypothetical protein